MNKKIDLLIIDPQVDFCDPIKNVLYVKNAEKDIERISDLIKRIGEKLRYIHVTLDTHQTVHIAHPIFWVDVNGNHPLPYTIIKLEDVLAATWLPFIPGTFKQALHYIKSLEENKRYPLCIWPPHCLIGSDGQAVMQPLFDTLKEWEQKYATNVNYITKGSNSFTEHYSAIKADVPDMNDPSTLTNIKLIETLEDCDSVLVVGEAGSHCVANTVKDIVSEFLLDGISPEKLVLLEDGMSPVSGFEQLQDDFIKSMVAMGVQVSNTKDFIIK